MERPKAWRALAQNPTIMHEPLAAVRRRTYNLPETMDGIHKLVVA